MSTNTVPNVASAIETVTSHLHPKPSYQLEDHPQPTGREEIWRFTPIQRLASLLAPAPEARQLNWEGNQPEGAQLTMVDADVARELAVEPPVDRIAALAAQTKSQAARLQIAADVELSEPVVFTGRGEGGRVSEMFVLEVGANAAATVVLRFEGTAEYACKYDIHVGDGASLNLVYVNDWDDSATHGGQLSLEIGRDAKVRTIHASLGGDVVRLVERAKYAGPGGQLEQFGLYFVDAGQHIEHRILVDHNAPHTSSNVDYRGALQGEGARSVWIGDVLIRKVAEGIETYESNKNLVLTDGCQADSVPNLEIETGEILGAGHSSTTGRFDDLQLFYLRSRGIPEAEARRLVVHGFFNDIIRRIGVPEIEERMREQVEKELNLALEQSA